MKNAQQCAGRCVICFGNTTEQKKVTSSGPQWLTDAGQSNLNFATNLQSQGFKPYTGQQVAGFSPQQQASFGSADDLSASVNGGPIGQLTSNYANAGPQHVSADSIYSNMSPYMNQYVNLALQPQLQMQDQQFATQNKGVDSAASMAGAFGDTGWGQLRGTTTQAQDAARTGLIGNAYNAAFNTAIGAGAQDVANKLNASTTNASLAETALGRQLTGANAMQSQKTGAATLENQFGGQQTAAEQAKLNAAYNQWQMAQQYPFQTTQLVNSTLGAANGVAPKTQTTYAPDNSGYGLLGSALAIGAAPFTGGASLAMLPATMGSMGGSNSSAPGQPQSAMWSADGQRPMFAADGGQIPGNAPTVVGERGPEVFIPNVPGVVIPNEVLEAARDKRAKKVAAPTLNFGIAA